MAKYCKIRKKLILNETKKFYEKLYKDRKHEENENFFEKFKDLDIIKLTLEEKESIEGPIKENEAQIFLKNMKNDKSPGADGFTAEFFKFFWIDLKSFIIRAINTAYETGEMSNMNKLGIITCIPKQDKSKQFLKNWRPITL